MSHRLSILSKGNAERFSRTDWDKAARVAYMYPYSIVQVSKAEFDKQGLSFD